MEKHMLSGERTRRLSPSPALRKRSALAAILQRRKMEDHAFDAMLDFRNMYQAYKRASRSKHSKQEVIDFELDLSRNLWSIIRQMEDKTYRVGGYHRFMIQWYEVSQKSISW